MTWTSAPITPPFIRETDSVTKIMADVLFALLPCCAMAWLAFGWTPVLVILVSCASALLTEFLFSRFFHGKTNSIADGSALVTGTLLACTLAPFTPLYIVAFGGVAAVLFGKLLQGGLGRNRFNPALIGREFMTIFFPVIMTSGAIWYQPDAVKFADTTLLPNAFLNSLLFEGSGAIGEYSVFFLVLGGIYLLVRNRINWHIPTALTMAFTLLFLAISLSRPQAEYSFSLAGVLLGAIFMATDMPSSASTRPGQLYYGAMIGIVAALCIALDVRYAYMSYAILLLNAFVTPINWVFRSRVWGEAWHWPSRITQAAGLTLIILLATWGLSWLHAQDGVKYLLYIYIAWSLGHFVFRRIKPEVLVA